MCACDETRGRKFLPHQLSEGTWLESQLRVVVTLGFTPNICDECRGLPAAAYPVSATHGRTTKIKRYYWRELAFRQQELFEQYGGKPEHYLSSMYGLGSEAYKLADQQALSDIKYLHETAPKYVYNEESTESVVSAFNIQIHNIHVEYLQEGGKKVKVHHNGESLTVEGLAEAIYRSKGYEVLLLESMPFHVLFGVFTWLLIQDPHDPNVQICGFGERSAYEADGSKIPIWTHLPIDFGTPSYARRRAEKIESHFHLLRPSKDDLLWLFDYWLPLSEGLRQYLWAHRKEHVIKARRLIEILEPTSILKVLRYLVTDYWGRYLGWPDLLAFNSTGPLFVEVKSSKDKLSEDQKHWIKGNSEDLNFPFEILKVHRSPT